LWHSWLLVVVVVVEIPKPEKSGKDIGQLAKNVR
jgi:hypothetical protein